MLIRIEMTNPVYTGIQLLEIVPKANALADELSFR